MLFTRIFHLHFLFIFFIFNNILSQEINNNTISIESLMKGDINFNIIDINTFKPKGLTNKEPYNFFDFNFQVDDSDVLDITNKTNLVSPTWEIRQSFNEGSGSTSEYQKDFNLGFLETDSNYIIIKCRDHEYIDGDRIRLKINGSIIYSNITLSSNFYIVDVDLKDGYNNIEFIALNEGEASPNTAQLVVYDEFGKLLSNKKWLISTGYKATLGVYKK
jgi:hypothetical protein